MFTFEPLTAEDLPFLLEVRNECRDFLHDNRAFTLGEARSWFKETTPDFRVIRCKGERVGYFRLSNYDPTDRSIYIGADLHKAYRQRGLARRAYGQFLPHLAETLGISTFKLEVLSNNIAARKLYTKLGFVEVKREKGFGTRFGKLVDNILMHMPAGATSEQCHDCAP